MVHVDLLAGPTGTLRKAVSKCTMVSVGNRPQPAGRDRYPISIVRASWASGEWPLFAEQIDVITASIRPQPVDHAFMGYVSNRLIAAC